MPTNKTATSAPVTSDEGTSNPSLLTSYLAGVNNFAHAKGELSVSLVEIEVTFIRASVKALIAKEVSVRDIQATI